MPDHAKISGYTPEAVAKILKAFDSHPVKGSWRKHRKIEELEYYQCEITWLSKSRAVDHAGDVISPLTLRSCKDSSESYNHSMAEASNLYHPL